VVVVRDLIERKLRVFLLTLLRDVRHASTEAISVDPIHDAFPLLERFETLLNDRADIS
jgi:hypothetical protein